MDNTPISTQTMLALYEKMLLIRRFEERVDKLFRANVIGGFGHLYIGEEAVATGVCANLKTSDYIVSTHRGHGHVIAKGGDVKAMMAELFGKKTGYCKGKGGSMHITDMKIGMLGANGIVGGGLPIALGSAYGAAYLGHTDQITVAFFGDGATSEGTFHETCNMAAALHLPIVFVCENNFYGVGSRIGRISPSEEMTDRVAGYHMAAESVDGNDVLAVYEAAGRAVEKARKHQGPVFIECKTWRHQGHFVFEEPNYWDRAEYDAWFKKDPIPRFAAVLLEKKAATQASLDKLNAEIVARIDAAVEFAEKSELPAPEDALEDVFA